MNRRTGYWTLCQCICTAQVSEEAKQTGGGGDVLGGSVFAIQHVGNTLHAAAFTQLVGQSLDTCTRRHRVRKKTLGKQALATRACGCLVYLVPQRAGDEQRSPHTDE
jgi:hypothetical protein